METFEFKVELSIQKPAAEVYDAIVNPEKMSGYFIKSSSGPLQEGRKVSWRFPEFDMDVLVSVHQVIPNKLVRMTWAQEEGYETTNEIVIKSRGDSVTTVAITESGWHNDEKSRKDSYRNCGGWMHMLCCLKAYLEHGGINLRTGSFGHMAEI